MNYLIAIDHMGGCEYAVSNMDTDEVAILPEEAVESLLSPIQCDIWTEGGDMFAIPAEKMQAVLQGHMEAI